MYATSIIYHNDFDLGYIDSNIIMPKSFILLTPLVNLEKNSFGVIYTTRSIFPYDFD
jgi:hypothetical protein